MSEQFRVTNEGLSPDAEALAVARDAILCAVTNLESPHPQPVGPEAAARLRAAADLLTKLDKEATTYVNEVGANALGEVLAEARAVRLAQMLRYVAGELPDYMTDLRNAVLRTLENTK